MIPDGYNYNEFIRSVPGAYPDLHYTRRHMTIDEIDQWVEEAANPDRAPAERNKIWRTMMQKALVKWDLKKPDGTSATIDADSFNNMHRGQWNRLLNIVLGREAPDLDPKGGPAAADDWQKRVNDLAAGKNAAAAADRDAAKN